MTLVATTQSSPRLEQFNVSSAAFHADPFPALAWMRRHAPVYPARVMGGITAYLVTKYDDVMNGLKNDADIRKGKDQTLRLPGFLRPLERNMLDMDDPDHARLRSLVHQAFTPRLIGNMQQRVHDLAHDLLTKAQRQGELELIHDYALQIPMTIISEMLGVPERDRTYFHRLSSQAVNIVSPAQMIAALPALYQFVRYLRRMCRERALEPRDDLMSLLAQAQLEGSKLSEDELIGMIFLLLVAGHETTVNLIGNGTLALLTHPSQLEHLRDRPEIMKTAVEELTRFTAPVLFATERWATRDLEVAGTRIPKGALILLGLGSANRDETRFARPDDLNLERADNKHLGFGQGVHYCLGAPLARLEAGIAFSVLLERLPELRLAQAPETIRWRPGLITRGLLRLPLRF
jgi:cytochrome P450